MAKRKSYQHQVWLPNAKQYRENIQQKIDKAEEQKTKAKSKEKPKLNLDKFKSFERLTKANKSSVGRPKNLSGYVRISSRNPMAKQNVLDAFEETVQYLQSKEYIEQATKLIKYGKNNTKMPHLNKDYVTAMMWKDIEEEAFGEEKTNAHKKYEQYAIRAMRAKMSVPEIKNRMNYEMGAKKEIIELMSKVAGYTGATDEQKVTAFYDWLHQAKSHMPENWDSRDAINQFISEGIDEFLTKDFKIDTKKLVEHISLSRGDMAAVSADIDKEMQEHEQYPKAKAEQRRREEYLSKTLVSDIEWLDDEFMRITGLKGTSKNISGIEEIFGNSYIEDITRVRKIVDKAKTLVTESKSKNKYGITPEVFRIVKQLINDNPGKSESKIIAKAGLAINDYYTGLRFAELADAIVIGNELKSKKDGLI